MIACILIPDKNGVFCNTCYIWIFKYKWKKHPDSRKDKLIAEHIAQRKYNDLYQQI